MSSPVRTRKPVIEAGVWPQAYAYSNLTTTYVELDAVLAETVAQIYVHNTSSTIPIIMATGAAGSEVPFFIAPPLSSVLVSTEDILYKGLRLAIKTPSGTIVSGFFVLNGYKG
jgi:hypothetical protein